MSSLNNITYFNYTTSIISCTRSCFTELHNNVIPNTIITDSQIFQYSSVYVDRFDTAIITKFAAGSQKDLCQPNLLYTYVFAFIVTSCIFRYFIRMDLYS